MWATIGKVLVRLIPPDKLVEIILIGFFIVVILIGLLFAGPIMVFKHIPLGKYQHEYDYYIDAAHEIEQQTGIFINWQNIMAIDAVLLNQDYTLSSFDRALGYRNYFIREVTETKEIPCEDEIDSQSNEADNEDEENRVCTTTVTYYYERPYDETLQLLVLDGRLRRDQIEDVKRYTIIDANPFLVNNLELPDNWMPNIQDYAWPISGHYYISSGFGNRSDPFEHRIKTHNGIDIPVPVGTQIVAVKDGKVITAGELGNAGITVIIDHGENVQSRYYHLSKLNVKTGQRVARGELIGESGNTGRSTGPHLHFEIRVSNNPVDPLHYYK